ncbi:MAG: hypothetical protein ACRDGA_02600, partial [Bacteroidota bacterium]
TPSFGHPSPFYGEGTGVRLIASKKTTTPVGSSNRRCLLLISGPDRTRQDFQNSYHSQELLVENFGR